jgi:hypothetical protein
MKIQNCAPGPLTRTGGNDSVNERPKRRSSIMIGAREQAREYFARAEALRRKGIAQGWLIATGAMALPARWKDWMQPDWLSTDYLEYYLRVEEELIATRRGGSRVVAQMLEAAIADRTWRARERGKKRRAH